MLTRLVHCIDARNRVCSCATKKKRCVICKLAYLHLTASHLVSFNVMILKCHMGRDLAADKNRYVVRLGFLEEIRELQETKRKASYLFLWQL